MRLIDADKLIEKMNSARPTVYTARNVVQIVADEPTAYDLDKVIEQLANKITPNEDAVTGEPLNNPCILCETETIEECIGIVRSGVVNS